MVSLPKLQGKVRSLRNYEERYHFVPFLVVSLPKLQGKVRSLRNHEERYRSSKPQGNHEERYAVPSGRVSYRSSWFPCGFEERYRSSWFRKDPTLPCSFGSETTIKRFIFLIGYRPLLAIKHFRLLPIDENASKTTRQSKILPKFWKTCWNWIW